MRVADAAMREVEGFKVLLGEHEKCWPAIREGFARAAEGELRPGWVRASFLAAEDRAGAVVGRVSIRWELNEQLRRVGGHVGYAVWPEHRRKGHATGILRGALRLLSDHGVQSALVTCAEDNIGSVRVIEACGGVRRDTLTHSADGTALTVPTLRFDVPTAGAFRRAAGVGKHRDRDRRTDSFHQNLRLCGRS